MPQPLTLGEFRKETDHLPEDTPIHICYNYGDRSNTPVAPAVDEIIEGSVTRSDYHNMDRLVDDEDDRYSFRHPVRPALILRA
jgi:hypothetical protein